MSGPRLIFAFGLVLIFCQISNLSAQIAPVLIFGGESSESIKPVDALRRISSNEFAKIVDKKVGGSHLPMAVFVRQDNFCVEHLSQQKVKPNTSEVTYLPLVELPVLTLEDIKSYNVTREEKPETITNGQMNIFSVLNLADVPEMWGELRSKNPDLLGIITGPSCDYIRSERTRRAVAARADSEELILQADRILFYSTTGIQYKTGDSTNFTSLGAPTTYSSVSNESRTLRFDLTFAPDSSSEITLRLNFNATLTNYWNFTSVEYETSSSAVTMKSNTTVIFPYNFSYHCTVDLIFYHNTTFLNFTDIQVQIDPKLSADNATAVFSDGYDCIGFTTIPIWSGIFVTFILAFISIWGLTMIMDIRTMDRFDDPKGKTITTAVSE